MENSSQEQVMNRAARRLARRRIGGLAGMSLVATTGLLGAYLGNPRMPRAYAAAVCTVTTSDDSGAGSLRQALLDHDEEDADCSTINFASSVTTIRLESNLPTLTNASSLTITGPGSGLLTVNLNRKSGIRMDNPADGQTLSISGLTLTNAYFWVRGGAVYGNNVSVAISDVTFTSNQANSGGAAVRVVSGSLDVANSTFTSNSTRGGGGALSVSYSSSVSITGSTFTSNSADGSGGAIYSGGTPVSITNSTFTSNTSGRKGGAVKTSYGQVDITGSTFTSNSAQRGGALFMYDAPLNIANSTFTANTASTSGGAVYMEEYFEDEVRVIEGNVTANFTTFSGNTAPSGRPQSIELVTGGGTYTVSNSIFDESALALKGSTGSAATFSFFNSASALTDETRAGSGVILATTAGVAPLNLGTLANNGGTTLTMLPGTGSPVIGTANRASSTPTVDQRGETRTSPSTMGAVAVDAAPAPGPAPAPAPDPDPTPTPTATPTATPTPTPTPTPTTSVAPVVAPVVTRPVVVAPTVLANGRVVVLPVAQRGNAQVVEVNAPASTSVANAPEVIVSVGVSVAPVVSGLPANRPIFAALRILRSGSQTTTSLLRAKSSFVPMGTARSTATGRVKIPAFKATRPGVYTIRLSTAEGKAYYVKVKVTARKIIK
jgi:predicted outer membrane repeat protein